MAVRFALPCNGTGCKLSVPLETPDEEAASAYIKAWCLSRTVHYCAACRAMP